MIMIDKTLFKEIEEYCIINDKGGIQSFINKLLRDSFNIEKYGIQPFIDNNKPKEVVIENVVEKIVYVTNDVECDKKIEDIINKYETEIDTLKKEIDNSKKIKNKGDIYGE